MRIPYFLSNARVIYFYSLALLSPTDYFRMRGKYEMEEIVNIEISRIRNIC